MPVESLKTKAVVIKSRACGENDRILTLLSPTVGKLFVVAKGARSLKHKSRACTQLFSYGSFVLKKIKDDLYSLVSGETESSFSKISENIVSLSYASYFCNLCEFFITTDTPAQNELRLFLNSLYILAEKPHAASYVKLVFELRLSALCGFMPDFSEKCHCGAKAAFFSYVDGETRCNLHKNGDGTYISSAECKLAKFLLTSSLKDALLADISPDNYIVLGKISEAFLIFQLGFVPKSLSYLRKIVKNGL